MSALDTVYVLSTVVVLLLVAGGAGLAVIWLRQRHILALMSDMAVKPQTTDAPQVQPFQNQLAAARVASAYANEFDTQTDVPSRVAVQPPLGARPQPVESAVAPRSRQDDEQRVLDAIRGVRRSGSFRESV